MELDVLLTPRDVQRSRLADRAVVVFDVLRATTTMTAALAAGVSEIRVFDSLDTAQASAAAHSGPRVLCGERNCLPPEGFDLGNSPGGFAAEHHAGQVAFMSTTNGTRAIIAARNAKLLLAGAVVNATAVARELAAARLGITLLCAGTDGAPALEDLLGAGAVIDALARFSSLDLNGDVARIALQLFQSCRDDLRLVMADATGGRNILAVGLGEDIDFAARLDALREVGVIHDNPLRVVNTNPTRPE